MGMAGRDIHSGAFTIGSFVVVNTYLIQLYLPLNFLGYIYREIRQSLADMERMFSILGEKRDIVDIDDAPAISMSKAAVSPLTMCRFPMASRQILHDVSFSVPAGNAWRLSGPAAQGNQPFCGLLFRFYDPDEGEIRIDGQPIHW